MSTEITQYTAPAAPHALALDPQSGPEAMNVAAFLHQSGLFKHLEHPGAVFAVIAKGREVGLSMMASLTGINVIKGKISMSAEVMAGLCLGRRDVCEYFTHVSSDATQATYKTKRRGSDEVRHTFTMEDAKALGVSGNDNYRKQPATMLRHRCESALARMVYPDLLAGCYTPEEIEAIDPAPAERITATAEPAKTGPAALGLAPVPPLRTSKKTPIEEARAALATADTGDKLDNLEVKIQNSPKLTAEEKGILTTEIGAARERLNAGGES